MSSQKAKLIVLMRALDLSEGKKINIWSDSKYAFRVVHAHGTIWKERGLLNAQGSTLQNFQTYIMLSSPIGLYTPAPPFQPGDWVYIKWWDSDPLQAKWRRPFQVLLTTLTTVKVTATQPDRSFQPYSKIKKLPSEPFVTFVERLTRAIELQVKNEGAQEQVLEEMALADANEWCKAAILSLSIEPAPTFHDMLQQKSLDMIVKDPATRETKSPHDQVTWGHGYAYVSTPRGLKWVPAEWVKPFIPKTAKPPAEAPQVASAA
ncbi:hypothetical protein DUI87_19184 [Hirundo rustica rustica]|uniref:Uncharacterized protein n=1 Tax=Hirundo rustica rustica TaxID=333673 RepID=A0A3M0JUG6_HIRRU|nr:hypothetical protein DUI87_19184 [Hirundo rustica rustica]